MTQNQPLYTAVVGISQDFLGPAGERFMRRQISTHLNIEPEDLKKEHIGELVDWVSLTFAVLTNNTKYVEDFSQRLLALADSKLNKSHE
jgi:hypothetical protein